jgi:hypothetical protein
MFAPVHHPTHPTPSAPLAPLAPQLEAAERRLIGRAYESLLACCQEGATRLRLVVLGDAPSAHVAEIAERLAPVLGDPQTERVIHLVNRNPERLDRFAAELQRRDGALSFIRHVEEDLAAGFKRAAMHDLRRGHVLALWLGSSVSSSTPLELRRELRALRRSMWLHDALMIGAESARGEGASWMRESDRAWLYSPNALLTMCAAAAFQTRGQWIDSEARYSLTLLAAD